MLRMPKVLFVQSRFCSLILFLPIYFWGNCVRKWQKHTFSFDISLMMNRCFGEPYVGKFHELSLIVITNNYNFLSFTLTLL
ncbi:uncharacterized protein EV154DRAFT_489511 [Mucor mucedo]|uniref:uncharacterized protein n=1 Tax=Mucor mucedo TaxID=29922 RepID=UPI002220343F|nr:uncharacterized protein EV154DRAFT_489511 [Mucor mucedo]KAI7897266.1 hypothetical protein EV154DRAFT_489511 [Mucor mucedo]